MNANLPGSLLIDPQVLQNPYPLCRNLQAHAPVWEVTPGEVYLISSWPRQLCRRRYSAKHRRLPVNSVACQYFRCM